MASETIAKIDSLSYASGSFTKACASYTDETVGTITLPESGTWLVLCFMDSAISSNTMYNILLGSRTVRASMTSGGGAVNYILTSSTSIPVRTYVQTACTMRVWWEAIRIA